MIQKAKSTGDPKHLFNKLGLIFAFFLAFILSDCDNQNYKKQSVGNLVIEIDTSLSSLKRLSDPQGYLKNLLESDSVCIRFLGLFDKDSVIVETLNYKKTLKVHTNLSTYFANQINVSRKSNSTINMYYHNNLFKISINKRYSFIDVRTLNGNVDTLKITYSNQILILT